MLIRPSLASLAFALSFTSAFADVHVPGQKIDSGLGDLPHYSLWAQSKPLQAARNKVPGESLDSGLGELPHYSQWKDPSGKDPLGKGAVVAANTLR